MTGQDYYRAALRRARIIRCALSGGHTGGRPLGAFYLCGRCRAVVNIATGRTR